MSRRNLRKALCEIVMWLRGDPYFAEKADEQMISNRELCDIAISTAKWAEKANRELEKRVISLRERIEAGIKNHDKNNG